ncbi:MAG: DUF4097 family beta strand repeat-containing protein, partial [Candidatus Neomarinimicrobiota bacterium]
MSPKPAIAALLIGLLLGGQGTLSARDDPVGSPAQDQQEPELREYRGKYQGVIVHRMEADPRATLIMKSLKGDIVLLGTDVHRIVIEEKITVRTRSRDRALESIDRVRGVLTPPKDKQDAYVFQVGKSTGRDVFFDYKVKLPRVFNLIIQSYGGDIDMTDLQGDLEAKTGGGDIALSKSAGKVMLKTGGGDIDLFQLEGQVNVVTGGGDIKGRTVEGMVDAHTGGGDIEFWDCKGNMDLNTGGGDIELEGMEGTELEARTGGGDIDIRDITARTNLMTGGGDITAESVNGAIEVATSGGDVDMHGIRGDAVIFSAAGDISVHGIDGAVRARNNSGDICIEEMTLENPGRDGSTFTTSYGDVRVGLSTAKSVAVIATILGYTPRYAVDRIHGNLDFNYRHE